MIVSIIMLMSIRMVIILLILLLKVVGAHILSNNTLRILA